MELVTANRVTSAFVHHTVLMAVPLHEFCELGFDCIQCVIDNHHCAALVLSFFELTDCNSTSIRLVFFPLASVTDTGSCGTLSVSVFELLHTYHQDLCNG